MNLNECILAVSLYIIPMILTLLFSLCIDLLGDSDSAAITIIFFPFPLINIIICIISLLEIFIYLIPKQLSKL